MDHEQDQGLQGLIEEVSKLVEIMQQEQQQELEQKQQQEEQQKKEDEFTKKTIDLLEEQNKSLQNFYQTLNSDSATSTAEILQKLDEISTKMDNNSKMLAEFGWMITLSIVLAVGFKLFWDNVLKW